MSERSPARYLAPLAIVGALVALVVVYTATFGSDESPTQQAAGTKTSTATTATGTTATGTTASGKSPTSTGETSTGTTSDEDGGGDGGRTYTVQSGDILSVIAEQQGVTVERILELNPDIDPQSLQAGDELRLEP